MSFQIKKYGLKNREILKRVKTWVYIFAIFQLLFALVDSTFKPDSILWGWAVFIDINMAIFR